MPRAERKGIARKVCVKFSSRTRRVRDVVPFVAHASRATVVNKRTRGLQDARRKRFNSHPLAVPTVPAKRHERQHIRTADRCARVMDGTGTRRNPVQTGMSHASCELFLASSTARRGPFWSHFFFVAAAAALPPTVAFFGSAGVARFALLPTAFFGSIATCRFGGMALAGGRLPAAFTSSLR